MTTITPLLLILIGGAVPQNPAELHYQHWSQGQAILEQEIVDDFMHHPDPDRDRPHLIDPHRLEWDDHPLFRELPGCEEDE